MVSPMPSGTLSARRRAGVLEGVKDFVSDAYTHYKHIGYVEGAAPLLEVAGIAEKLDEACHDLGSVEPAAFVEALAGLRRWERDV